MTRNEIAILGTGTSTGIPMVGCHCNVCESKDPKDTRLRTSISIKFRSGKRLLVDTTPDLRAQLLRAKIEQIDAVILTHDHADHIHGIDELRPLSYFKKQEIPIYVSHELAPSIKDRFPYIFKAKEIYADKPILGGGIPLLSITPFTPDEKGHTILGEELILFEFPHGYTKTVGFIHERFAYITDCQMLPEKILTLLKNANLDFLIIEYIQPTFQGTHLHQELVFKYLDEIQPKRAGLIHMNHFISHQVLTEICQKRFSFPVAPLFDGEVISY